MGLKLVSDDASQKKEDVSYTESYRNDFRDLEEPVVRMQPVYHAGASEKSHMSGNSMMMVLNFCQILVYLVSIAITGIYVYVIMQGKFNLYNALMNMKIYIQLSGLVFVADAIVVNIFYQKDKSLIIFSIILSFFYPAKRDSVTGGRLGTMCTIAMTITFVIILGQFLIGISKYSVSAMTLQDEYSTEHVKEFMEQTIDGTSEELGDLLRENIQVDSITLKNVNGKDTVTIQGMGEIYYMANSLYAYDYKGVRTCLVFSRDSVTQKYILQDVELNDTSLNNSNVDFYWENVWLKFD